MPPLSDRVILTTVRDVLPQARAVYLFGSHADGTARPDSDLDLAVLLPGRADPVRLWEAGEALARRFDTDVDLVDLLSASTVLQHQVVTGGRQLFADGPDVDRYEAFILSEMTALNEARAPLIADIQREGRVHAG